MPWCVQVCLEYTASKVKEAVVHDDGSKWNCGEIWPVTWQDDCILSRSKAPPHTQCSNGACLFRYVSHVGSSDVLQKKRTLTNYANISNFDVRFLETRGIVQNLDGATQGLSARAIAYSSSWSLASLEYYLETIVRKPVDVLCKMLVVQMLLAQEHHHTSALPVVTWPGRASEQYTIPVSDFLPVSVVRSEEHLHEVSRGLHKDVCELHL